MFSMNYDVVEPSRDRGIINVPNMIAVFKKKKKKKDGEGIISWHRRNTVMCMGHLVLPIEICKKIKKMFKKQNL